MSDEQTTADFEELQAHAKQNGLLFVHNYSKDFYAFCLPIGKNLIGFEFQLDNEAEIETAKYQSENFANMVELSILSKFEEYLNENIDRVGRIEKAMLINSDNLAVSMPVWFVDKAYSNGMASVWYAFKVRANKIALDNRV